MICHKNKPVTNAVVFYLSCGECEFFKLAPFRAIVFA